MREYRKDKIRKHRLKLSSSPLDPTHLFYSMYEFTGEALEKVQNSKSTAGLQGLPMKSDTLYIDLDSLDLELVEKVCNALSGLDYVLLESGGKGYHWHVPHQEVTSPDLIYSHKQFIKDLGLSDIVDTSIYRESGIIRREGTLHDVTGRPKKRIKVNVGTQLHLPIIEKPELPDIESEEDLIADWKFRQNLLRYKEIGVGGRHIHFYILWKNGLRAGRSEAQVSEDIHWFNEMLDEPKEEAQLDKEIRGFRR